MMIQFYANDYKDQVPLGYYVGQPWTGYYICQNGLVYPVLGRLWIGGYLKTGAQTFYCPSQGDNQFRFNAPNNPWPPPGPFSVHTRAGYTARVVPHHRLVATPAELGLATLPVESSGMDAGVLR